MSGAPAVVLLTGATGFVGKVVLAELLRRCEALGIERVLALVRAKDQEASRSRRSPTASRGPGSGSRTALPDQAPRYPGRIPARDHQRH